MLQADKEAATDPRVGVADAQVRGAACALEFDCTSAVRRYEWPQIPAGRNLVAMLQWHTGLGCSCIFNHPAHGCRCRPGRS